MGAEIVWPPIEADGGARRIGVLRFGPFFAAASRRDPYDGCGTVEDWGARCVIGPLAGEITEQDRNDILDACAGWGFREADVERRGVWWTYDLTARPFRRCRKGA